MGGRTILAKRSKLKAPEARAELEPPPLAWFNSEVMRCVHGLTSARKDRERAAFLDSLVAAEAERERLYGIRVPRRRSI